MQCWLSLRIPQDPGHGGAARCGSSSRTPAAVADGSARVIHSHGASCAPSWSRRSCVGRRDPPPLAGQIDGSGFLDASRLWRLLAERLVAALVSPGESQVARLGHMAGVFLDRVLGRPHDACAVENGTTPTGVAILLQAIALRRDGEVPGRASEAAGGGRRSLAPSGSRNAGGGPCPAQRGACRLPRPDALRAPSAKPRTLSS